MIYGIDYLDCELKYTHMTDRNLKYRITPHKSDINKRKDACALSHVHSTKHKPDFTNVKMLAITTKRHS